MLFALLLAVELPSSGESLGILGVLAAVVAGTAAWILKYKNDQLNYLFGHFRTELEKSKGEVETLKQAHVKLSEQNATLREEKASLLAQVAHLTAQIAQERSSE